MREGRDLQLEGHIAAQADGERRGLGVPVVRVCDDDRVGTQLLLVLHEEVLERSRAELLLTFDEYGEPEVEVGPEHVDEGADGAHVCEHSGLVVCGTAAVEPVTANGRLEGRGVPFRVVSGRLHVVVRVEEDRRSAVSGCARREHGGLALFVSAVDEGARHLDGIEDPEPVEESLDRVGTRRDVRRIEAIPRDRGNAYEVGEICDGRRQAELHGLPECVE